MPGMSPRIKAKKGRFGTEGLVHTVQILSPASGSSFSLAADFPFTATAEVTDDLGAVTGADVVWTSNVNTGIGLDGTPTAITLTTLGTHVITATVTNGTQIVTDTITVEVVA